MGKFLRGRTSVVHGIEKKTSNFSLHGLFNKKFVVDVSDPLGFRTTTPVSSSTHTVLDSLPDLGVV